MNAEAALASEFLATLAAAKSIPDAAIACQTCASHQMEMFAENGRQFMAAGERMIPKLLGNGYSGAGT